MSRVCTICTHAEHEAIDRELVAGTDSIRRIATRYGLSETSVRRHKAEHLPQTLVKAQDAAEVVQADDLLQQVRDLQVCTLRILDRAEEDGRLSVALQAIATARQNVELLGKLLIAAAQLAPQEPAGDAEYDFSHLSDAELEAELMKVTSELNGVHMLTAITEAEREGVTTLAEFRDRLCR